MFVVKQRGFLAELIRLTIAVGLTACVGVPLALFFPVELWPPWKVWRVPPWAAVGGLWSLVIQTWTPDESAIVSVLGALSFIGIYVIPITFIGWGWLFLGGLVARVYLRHDNARIKDPFKACTQAWVGYPFCALGVAFVVVGVLAAGACLAMIPVGIISFVRSFL